MAHILLVLCGGTICTTVKQTENGTVRTLSDTAGLLLTANYKASDSPVRDDVTFDMSENFEILSENMTMDKWNRLIAYFRSMRSSLAQYDGIIVAHGTDTLAYSCALFSLLLRNIGLPVFFVSSNEPLRSPRANGNLNFRKAVECICMGIQPNVYAVYRNPSSGRLLLHLGSRLTQCASYSEDFFSEGSVDITSLSPAECTKLFRDGCVKAQDLLDLNTCPTLTNCVLKIEPYVGLNYDAFDLSRYRAVLHGTYHSGTACTERTDKSPAYGSQSILRLVDRCGDTTDVYLSPAKKSGEIYDSVGILAQHNHGCVRFLYGMTNEMAYVKLLLAYALGVSDVEAFMHTPYNAEIIHR